jgi:hypothetical protein
MKTASKLYEITAKRRRAAIDKHVDGIWRMMSSLAEGHGTGNYTAEIESDAPSAVVSAVASIFREHGYAVQVRDADPMEKRDWRIVISWEPAEEEA